GSPVGSAEFSGMSDMLGSRTSPLLRKNVSDAAIACLATGIVVSTVMLGAAQTPVYRAPRTADGKPNLNGIWQALNTADWDLQGHAAGKGPVASLGAV